MLGGNKECFESLWVKKRRLEAIEGKLTSSNRSKVRSSIESEFTAAIDDPSNNNLSQEQQQSLEKSKSKLIDSYNKVSFPAKKWMDSLPGTLKSGFALFALHLIDLVEFLMKKVSAPLRPIALVMFLKFARSRKI
jgi:hypothetical protein